MRWLANVLADDHARAAVELHFNAANGHARGCEWLFWNGSTRGKALASELRTAHRGAFPDQVDRGLKPRGAGDRGALFLRWTPCPAVICEPFFGDNPDEWSVFGGNAGRARLAMAVADGILRWLKPPG
jgi:N-acetylmuramoyl-L-alanine amidase